MLHRMVRVREAEVVPDLTAAILGAAPATGAAVARRRAAEPVSVARWALFVVALTQLVLAGPALLLGEDAGATVHVARELGSVRRGAGGRAARGRLAAGPCLGAVPGRRRPRPRDGRHRDPRRRAWHGHVARRGAPPARPGRRRRALVGRPRGSRGSARHRSRAASPPREALARRAGGRRARSRRRSALWTSPAAAHATPGLGRPGRRRPPRREPGRRPPHLQRARVGRPRRRPGARWRRHAGAGGRGAGRRRHGRGRPRARSARRHLRDQLPGGLRRRPPGARGLGLRRGAGRHRRPTRSGQVTDDGERPGLGGGRRRRPRPGLRRRAPGRRRRGVPRARAPGRRRARRTSCAVVWAAALVGAVGSMVALPVQAALGTGQGPARSSTTACSPRSPGTASASGSCWRSPGSWSPCRWSSAAAAIALAGAVVAAGSFATNGHTRAGSSAAVATIADVTHLLVAAAWGGGLVLLTLCLRAHRRAGEADHDRHGGPRRPVLDPGHRHRRPGRDQRRRPWRGSRSESLDALTGTGYGRLLLVKVGVVAVIAGARRLQPLPARPRPHPGQGAGRARPAPRDAARSRRSPWRSSWR